MKQYSEYAQWQMQKAQLRKELDQEIKRCAEGVVDATRVMELQSALAEHNRAMAQAKTETEAAHQERRKPQMAPKPKRLRSPRERVASLSFEKLDRLIRQIPKGQILHEP